MPKPMHFPLPTKPLQFFLAIHIFEAQKWPLFVNILGKP